MIKTGTGDQPYSNHSTIPSQLDSTLHQHITDYIKQYSLVKLEAALTEMVYSQFKECYRCADDTEKQSIEIEIELYIPNRARIKRYLQGEAICFRYVNTLANFFSLPYILNNHDPADYYQLAKSTES